MPRRQPQASKKAAAPAAAPDLQPAKMKVADLKEELGKRGLDTSGKKAELVSRLEAAIGASGGGPPPAKKVKVEEETDEGAAKEESDFSKAKRALAAETSGSAASKAGKKKVRNAKVDPSVPGGYSYSVEGDWDCMLNQTNIGQNNNKFYVIQMLKRNFSPGYTIFTRWGRVGEPGKHGMSVFSDIDSAEKEFKKKFRDKTRNEWDSRHSFTPVKGKYTLLEMDDESGDEEEIVSKLAALDEPDAPPREVKPCSLDMPTQALMKLIFDNDMFQDAMKSLEIDTKKMPLGKLSKTQIAKGFEALEAIEDGINKKFSMSKLAELSSKFYTIIPHSFGRMVPPVIRDSETLQKKFDMLMILGDIEIAQGLKKETDKKQAEVGELPNPMDVNYESLKTGLTHIKKEDPVFKLIETYTNETQGYRKTKILDVWEVDRDGESARFSTHHKLDNRRLLWHGTNVAVVAAILKSGLRIMPHSGGRVGRGIYFASENGKSAGYVRCVGNGTGIMFLNEVALGKEHHITMDDSSLVTPPSGFNSVVAKGRTEPDPKNDTSLTMDGRKVLVPQGKPIPVPQYSSSYFSQSEYLIYREDQCRIRYMLKMKF